MYYKLCFEKNRYSNIRIVSDVYVSCNSLSLDMFDSEVVHVEIESEMIYVVIKIDGRKFLQLEPLIEELMEIHGVYYRGTEV